MEIRFLIPVDTIKEIGFTNTNVEDNIVSTALLRVQDINLRPILGTTFFKRLLKGVEDEDLNVDETFLISEYIHPWIIAMVDHKVTLHLLLEIRSKTVGTTNDQYMSSADERQMLKLQDSLLADAEVYKDVLIGYLKDNRALFPEYNNYICSFENVRPEKSQSVKPNISFR